MASLRKYTEEDVEGALQLVALNRGSSTVAARTTGISRAAIDNWVHNLYSDRYRQIRAEIIPQIQAKLAARHEDMALQALAKQQEAFELMDLAQLKQPDLVKAARDLSVTSAVHTDKTQLLRDRPTVITEHRTGADVIDSIARRFPAGVIDSDAEEVEDAVEA